MVMLSFEIGWHLSEVTCRQDVWGNTVQIFLYKWGASLVSWTPLAHMKLLGLNFDVFGKGFW